MKKKSVLILVLLIIVISAGMVLVACSHPNYCKAQYSAEKGGQIIGVSEQNIKYGKDAESVTAIADENFRFVGWSDGLNAATRTDTKIKSDIEVTAQFEQMAGAFSYKYNNATANNETREIFLTRGELQGTEFAVPERDDFYFKGWYLDKYFKNQVSDENGNIVIGDEIFNAKTCELYAKWTAKEEIVYKVLIVYDTEIRADLKTVDGKIIKVDYKMTELERNLCKAMTIQFSNFLNTSLEGYIAFDVDEYFTTVPLGKENIYSKDQGTIIEYSINAPDIPEVSDKLDDYRSVINVMCFNDNEYNLRVASGHGGEKYASIFLESAFAQTIGNGDSLEVLFDFNYKEWDKIIDLFVHEFIHTLEQGITTYRYHNALNNSILGFSSDVTLSKEVNRDYLLNQAYVTDYDETVGIPYAFWQQNIFTLKYEKNGNGYISGDWYKTWKTIKYDEQRIPKGSRGTEVTAIPHDGYKFVSWSDGVTTAARIDYNLQSDKTVTAYFEPIALEIKYVAGEGGKIIGKAEQSVLCDHVSEKVTAVADEGYIFIGWSDGDRAASRQDYITWRKKGMQVTALFEKMT